MQDDFKPEQIDDVFADLPSDQDNADPFGDPVSPEVPAKDEEPSVEESKEPHKNRYHRRLEEKLQRERESNIALNERLRVLSEIKQTTQETGVDERLLRLYGSDDNGKEAARITAALLQDVRREAREDALKAFEERQAEIVREQKAAEQFIDDELSALEETHSVDLTSNAPTARKARAELRAILEKISPKDESGNIKEFGDFEAAYEIYQSRKEKPDKTRAKELASRSMVRSSTPTKPTSSEQEAEQSYLRRIGIL